MIVWIVRLWTKHWLLAVRCVYRRTQPTGVAHDVDAIPSVVMSLISHAQSLSVTHTRSQRSFRARPSVFGVYLYRPSYRPWN